jgi:hypothetical protein
MEMYCYEYADLSIRSNPEPPSNIADSNVLHPLKPLQPIIKSDDGITIDFNPPAENADSSMVPIENHVQCHRFK